MAEEPDEKGSFGMHRSAIAATAIVNAWRNGAQDVAARMREIELLFVEKGLTLERGLPESGIQKIFLNKPYFNKSRDGNRIEDHFLQTADRIANSLCRDALWDGARCTG